MRTVVPGSVSPAYLKALKDSQVEFFKSLLMDEEKAKEISERYPLNGIGPAKYPRPS